MVAARHGQDPQHSPPVCCSLPLCIRFHRNRHSCFQMAGKALGTAELSSVVLLRDGRRMFERMQRENTGENGVRLHRPCAAGTWAVPGSAARTASGTAHRTWNGGALILPLPSWHLQHCQAVLPALGVTRHSPVTHELEPPPRTASPPPSQLWEPKLLLA